MRKPPIAKKIHLSRSMMSEESHNRTTNNVSTFFCARSRFSSRDRFASLTPSVGGTGQKVEAGSWSYAGDFS